MLQHRCLLSKCPVLGTELVGAREALEGKSDSACPRARQQDHKERLCEPHTLDPDSDSVGQRQQKGMPCPV